MENILTDLGTWNDMLKSLLQIQKVCQCSRFHCSSNTMLYIRCKLELRPAGQPVTGNLAL